ncbi:signal peptidase II [Anaerorhabdus furcosa]|uniref:Lipoprotein signal peptidase n=1 Tax=Anaerorhabdus furcosa TaxID=118967 RepID=A0A1T4QDZ3_9FIRM|nr:signal peptidase II [Anaerorhabdus furcosa]SKA01807.1 signal peptidase II [Anaerorhabdus furcosa]
MKRKELFILIGILVLDLGTKLIVQSNLDLHHQIPIIDNFFYITYAKNTGAAWSMFSGRVGILTLMSLAGVGLFSYMFSRVPEENKWERISIVLMIAGAAGNLFDRFVFGYVRDFLDFVIFGYDFPIFNIADSALCIGIGLLIVITLFKKEEVNGKN